MPMHESDFAKRGLICEYLSKKMATVSDVMGVSLSASCFLVWLGWLAGDPDLCAVWLYMLEYMKHNESMPVSASA